MDDQTAQGHKSFFFSLFLPISVFPKMNLVSAAPTCVSIGADQSASSSSFFTAAAAVIIISGPTLFGLPYGLQILGVKEDKKGKSGGGKDA